MIKSIKFRKHLFLNLFLLMVLVLVAVVFLVNFPPMFGFEVIILAALTYVGMALAHHHFDKSLTIGIIVEYILIALLAIIVLQSQIG